MTNTTKNNCLQNSICHRVAPSKDLTIKPPKLNKNAPRITPYINTIPVQSGTKSFKNIIDILKNTKYFKDARPFIVHRLDKETSGVLIVAKNREYAQLFTSLFRIRKIHKTYLAITYGEVPENINS